MVLTRPKQIKKVRDRQNYNKEILGLVIGLPDMLFTGVVIKDCGERLVSFSEFLFTSWCKKVRLTTKNIECNRK